MSRVSRVCKSHIAVKLMIAETSLSSVLHLMHAILVLSVYLRTTWVLFVRLI